MTGRSIRNEKGMNPRMPRARDDAIASPTRLIAI